MDRSEIEELKEEIARLKNQVSSLMEGDRIFEKAFRVIGLHTNYIEFGAYQGGSLTSAFHAARKVYEELTGGAWDHSFKDLDDVMKGVHQNWHKMRFIAFDSFQGIPPTKGPDKEIEMFKEGTYMCGEAEFQQNIKNWGVDPSKVVTIPGFFEDTCTPEMARARGIENVGIVHIDSDLYASAKVALDFVTPLIKQHAVIIFDEWFHFYSHPHYGEQRAFREWQEENPDWHVVEFQREGAFRMSFIINRK